MKKWFRGPRLIVTGILVVLAGLLYSMIFAGIPYQDPTPAMEARWRFHGNIGDSLMLAGLALAFAGLINWLVGRR